MQLRQLGCFGLRVQLQDNLGALGCQLDDEPMARLNAASAATPPVRTFPHGQEGFARLNLPVV